MQGLPVLELSPFLHTPRWRPRDRSPHADTPEAQSGSGSHSTGDWGTPSVQLSGGGKPCITVGQGAEGARQENRSERATAMRQRLSGATFHRTWPSQALCLSVQAPPPLARCPFILG